MKLIIKIIIFFIAITGKVSADFESLGGDDVDISEFNQETLFVSLGSYCAPASLARSCGHRKAAFPFDWNICLDGEKLIEILKDKFVNFLNDDYLVPFGWATLLNTYYNLEFVHDGTWEEDNLPVYLPILKSKYKRRIKRFTKLKEYSGKVFFIRSAYVNSMVDLNRYYKIKENIEISEDYALRLFEALKDFFPTLNFSLIIINNDESLSVNTEKKLGESILMVRAGHAYTEPEMQASYVDFFNRLLLNEP